MRKRILACLVLLALAAGVLGPTLVVYAQNYSFSLDQEYVDLWINQDGSVRIEYWLTFTCGSGADPVDVIDLGLPNSRFSFSNIHADIGGRQLRVDGDYQGEGGSGVAVWLDSARINPGQSGTVHVVVERLEDMVYEDSDDSAYASSQFSPTWFDSGFVYGSTDMTVRFHLPPGIQPEEPRWHGSPSGWSQDQPDTTLDSEGRVLYIWHDPAADPDRQYVFGASFPRTYVDEGVVQSAPSGFGTGWLTAVGVFGALGAVLCNPFTIFMAVVAGIVGLSNYGQRQRKMKYLPPLLKVEGVGIKRGLTAVEAAILLETPLNKVLTMVLFGLLKKEAVTVLDDDPLKVEANEKLPDNLHPYEKSFIEAINKDKSLSEKKLRAMMVELVKEVNNKMKGFSRRETTVYYRDVIRRAWEQVEGAKTPEVRSQLFDERLEWTMLDRDFENRTGTVFSRGPVFMPYWWGYYRPWASTVSRAGVKTAASGSAKVPSSSGSRSVPTLPGSAFAATIVRGVQNTSGRIVGSLTGFTGKVTQVTNPPPKTSYSGKSYRGGGGGSSCACACACACAGCACACAGGGR